MRLLLNTYPSEKYQTLGILYLLDNRDAVIDRWHSLELPWKDNKKYISCIPEGFYTAYKHNSPKFGECLWIKEVPQRSEILIHVANFYKELLGCVCIGMDKFDIDKDGSLDVTSSKKAISQLLSLITTDKIELEIIRN